MYWSLYTTLYTWRATRTYTPVTIHISHYRVLKGADQKVAKRGGTRPSSALRLLRPGPSRPHAHSVRACGRPVGQRLPFDARAVCLPPVAAVAPVSAPSGDDACCSATALHCSGLRSGATVAAATSAGVMRAHFGARYTWPRRCCAGCCTAVADHLLLETMGCAAVGRSFVMSSNSTEAWDAQEWVVTELQHHPCRLFGPYPFGHTVCPKRRPKALTCTVTDLT